MNSDASNNLSLKYQRFTSYGCRDIGIRKLEFVAKTLFLSRNQVNNPFNVVNLLDLIILLLPHDIDLPLQLVLLLHQPANNVFL